MNANGSGQCRADASGLKPNHARSGNYIRLTDNYVKWKLQATETSNRDWALFRLRIGILGNCARVKWGCVMIRRLCSADISGPRYGEIVFAAPLIKLFK